MNEMSSAEFRKGYAKLREPTAVTVNGHVIGQWIPEGSATYVMARTESGGHEAIGLLPPKGAITRGPAGDDPTFRGGAPARSFSEFRPVPKPGRK